MSTAISVASLSKTFGSKRALNKVSFSVRQGQMVALLGASGSGKSTLLRHIGGLTAGDLGSGSIRVNNQIVQDQGRIAADIRAQRASIAMIFQQFNLVDRLPVMLNVLAGALHRQPMWRTLLRAWPMAEYAGAWSALRQVGIEECAWQRASTLSGGQQQRAAISRAVVQRAKVVLADEPIASLDPESSRRVMALLAQLNSDMGMTVLVSLHQVDFARAFCPRIIALRDGVVVFDGSRDDLTAKRLRDLYGADVDSLESVSDAETGRIGSPRLDDRGILAA